MAIVIQGNAGNSTTDLTATVASVANNGSGLARVSTSLPHGFGNADTVVMTAAPYLGPFSIVVVGASQFDLVASTFSTTATGTVVDLSLTPPIAFPTDGDPRLIAVGLAAGLQGLADRTQRLALTSQLILTVTSVGALQSLAPAAYQNQLVRLTPENNGNAVLGTTGLIGGIYYFDAAYNPGSFGEDGSTCIKPTTISASAPGRWRLACGPLPTVRSSYVDQSITVYSITQTTSGTGAIPSFSWNSATGTGPGALVAGDIVDVEADLQIAALYVSATNASWTASFTRNGASIPGSVSNVEFYLPAGTGNATAHLKTRYVVTPTDVATGSLQIGISVTLNAAGITCETTVIQSSYTVRRP